MIDFDVCESEEFSDFLLRVSEVGFFVLFTKAKFFTVVFVDAELFPEWETAHWMVIIPFSGRIASLPSLTPYIRLRSFQPWHKRIQLATILLCIDIVIIILPNSLFFLYVFLKFQNFLILDYYLFQYKLVLFIVFRSDLTSSFLHKGYFLSLRLQAFFPFLSFFFKHFFLC